MTIEVRKRRAFYLRDVPDGPYLRHGPFDGWRQYYINRDLFFYGRGARRSKVSMFNGVSHCEVEAMRTMHPSKKVAWNIRPRPTPCPTIVMPFQTDVKTIASTRTLSRTSGACLTSSLKMI